MKVIKLVGILFILVNLSACSITPKSYVDPQFQNTSYDQIKTVSQKYALKIEVEFQRNGEHLPAVDKELRSHVEQTLRATGVILPEENSPNILKVVVNNIADLGKARAKGFGTGLTLGAAGSVVQDYYEATIELHLDNKEAVSNSYKHTLHTIIGNRSAPEGIETTTPSDAFGNIVRDIILNFVKDMQNQDILSLKIDRSTICKWLMKYRKDNNTMQSINI